MPVPYWRLSAFYFCYFATLGAFLPYWNLYLKSLNFNSLEIGHLSALLVATRLIAPNVWGWFADRNSNSLRMIRWALFFGSLSFLGFFLISGFWNIAIITLVFGFFWNAPLPQFEAMTLAFLGREPYRYSRIRLWGSVGFIALVVAVGRVLDWLSVTLLPSIVAGLLIANWLVVLTLPRAPGLNSSNDGAGMMQKIMKPGVLAFLFVSMLLQIAHGPYYVFFSIYLQELGYTGTVIGGLWALGVLAEIVLFIWMRLLLARFSLKNMLLASFFLATIRWMLIGWCAEIPGILVIAQLLHAASFGAAHIASIHLVQHYFGAAHQNQGQALYSSVSFGLGAMLGSLYSGFLWEPMGAKLVYTLAAFFCYLAWLITYYRVKQENITNPEH